MSRVRGFGVEKISVFCVVGKEVSVRSFLLKGRDYGIFFIGLLLNGSEIVFFGVWLVFGVFRVFSRVFMG